MQQVQEHVKIKNKQRAALRDASDKYNARCKKIDECENTALGNKDDTAENDKRVTKFGKKIEELEVLEFAQYSFACDNDLLLWVRSCVFGLHA